MRKKLILFLMLALFGSSSFLWADNQTFDFEDSTLQGWTNIDADGDGNTWVLGSVAMATGYGHNGSTDMVLSKSYDNNSGALTPDNILVCPTKAHYGAISFYACAQDASYAAEMFAVVVSTTGNTSASAFTEASEVFTMTQKGSSGVKAPGRGGNRAQGNWYLTLFVQSLCFDMATIV